MNKPCPFCGGDGLRMTVLPAQFHGRTLVDVGPAQAWLMCECGYQSPFAASEERAGIEPEAWTAHNAGPVHALAERDGEWRRLIRERAELHEMAAGCDVDMSEIEAAGHRGSAAALRLLLEDGP